MFKTRLERIEVVDGVLDLWVGWCGDTSWSRSLKEYGELGGMIIHWCGVPRSSSAIPLCFELVDKDGKEIIPNQNSRLRDIKQAIKALKE